MSSITLDNNTDVLLFQKHQDIFLISVGEFLTEVSFYLKVVFIIFILHV